MLLQENNPFWVVYPLEFQPSETEDTHTHTLQ